MLIKQTPLISIIVPVYKVEKYLVKCVESILAQTYTNFELILVDDGSPDLCPSICDEYAKKDKRIIVIHKQNGGLSDARNAGLDIATGDFIGFVDSDDYIEKDLYELMLRGILNAKADMAICNYLCVDEDYNLIREKNKYLPIRDEVLNASEFITKYTEEFGWYYVVAWNKLYRKSLFDNLRYPLGKQHEDAFLIHYLAFRCGKIVCIRKGLYYYVQRQGSIMTQQFSIKNMDLGDALIDQYNYAKYYKIPVLKQYAVRRLSYKMEEWKSLSVKDECVERYNELRKKAVFLVYERAAWKDYPITSRLYYKLEILIPKLARILRKYLRR